VLYQAEPLPDKLVIRREIGRNNAAGDRRFNQIITFTVAAPDDHQAASQVCSQQPLTFSSRVFLATACFLLRLQWGDPGCCAEPGPPLENNNPLI
jgi:hypothetical protein